MNIITSNHGEKGCAISGIGLSEVSRRTDRSAMSLTIDACMAAIADAGLRRSDIDGLSSYPGADNNASGYSPIGVPQLMDALRLNVNWYSGGSEIPGQFGAIFNAIGAISAGLARHVLVFRTVYESQARVANRQANSIAKGPQRQRGMLASMIPYYALSGSVMQAPIFQRYVHETGIRPEQVGQIALNARRNAAHNPAAVYREPLTMEEYLNSEMLCTPMRLLDCDVPCNGSAAVIVSALDAAQDLPNPPIRFEAAGAALHDRNSWEQMASYAGQNGAAARMMWSRTDLRPSDVDCAQLYDGFTWHTVVSLENLGFCGRGEAGDFIGDGSRIALDGELPLATGGGQLSAGRLHAYGLLHEACTQLWGRGGGRQVKGDPKICAVSTAGGPLAGALLLARE